MRRTAWALVLLATCSRPPATPSAGAQSWPSDLVAATRVEIRRWQGGAPREAVVVKDENGIWQMKSPRQGEADPDTMTRLFFALHAPALLGPYEAGSEPRAQTFQIDLTGPNLDRTRIDVFGANLGQPIPVMVRRQHGDTTQLLLSRLVSPVEFSTTVPDPDDFLPAGLWSSAQGKATSVCVYGAAAGYSLHALGSGAWVSDDQRKPVDELGDIPGVITGRQVVAHPPPAAPSTFGLDKPMAMATLCTAQACRTFAFAKTAEAGRLHYFAQGPQGQPMEMHDDAWRLLVRGPFVRPGQ